MSLLRQSMNCALLAALFLASAFAAGQSTSWDKPAAELAHRIADQLGPSSARLTLRNVSQIPTDSLSTIRRLLTDDLKTAGISLTNGDSANTVRITLSENARGGLWIAEIVEGNQTRVVMVTLDRTPQPGHAATQKLALHIQTIATASAFQSKAAAANSSIPAIVSAAILNSELAVLFPSRLSVFENTPQGWTERAHTDLGSSRAVSRDPRGLLIPLPDGTGFDAFAPGVACSGQSSPAATDSQPPTWTLHCHPSDDPWPVPQPAPETSPKAFYNSARDYFTGIITPSPGVDIPAFYTAGLLPGRAAGPALLIEGIDGKVSLAKQGGLKPVAGTRDWGSDFAVITSACGVGAQVIVSTSGEGKSDSLRSYEIPAQEALAVSDPLQLPGAALAIWPAPDTKSALAIVRKPSGQGQSYDYEVDRVTQTCN